MPPAPPGVAFLLDMDGVIVHSTPVHNEAWRQYLERHAMALDVASIEAVMLGKHNNDIVRAFFGERLDQAAVAAHGAEKEKLYRELMRPRLAELMVPGIAEFLERHRHVPMGLASNAEPANVEFILDAARLRPYFRAVLNGHQVSRPKPDPEIYCKLAQALGVEPRDCVVFEDSAIGVEAARRAGSRVVGIATTTAALDDTELTIRDFRDPALDSWLEPILETAGAVPAPAGGDWNG
jgi:beta-phosphoglucomutase